MKSKAFTLILSLLLSLTLFAKEDFGQRFMKAADNHDLGMIQKLLAQGMDVNKIKTSYGSVINPLEYAVYVEDAKIVKLLIRCGADINGDGGAITPMISAIFKHSSKMVTALVEAGYDVNSVGYDHTTPLATAIFRHDYELVEVIVGLGADIEKGIVRDLEDFNQTPLQIATSRADHKMIELLVKLGANIDSFGSYYSNPLGIALDNKDYQTMRLLAQLGANIDYYDDDHPITAFKSALYDGDYTALNLLLAHGANIHGVTPGYTPLESAVNHNNIEMAKFLIERGAKIESDGFGYSSLEIAVSGGHLEMTKFLLTQGVTPRNANVVMKLAIDSQNKALVQYLIDQKIEITRESLKYAEKNGTEEIVEILKKHFSIKSSITRFIEKFQN